MKLLLKLCPRFTSEALKSIAIKDSELVNEKGQKIVNCSVCGLSNSKGKCKYINLTVRELVKGV
jgi:hypothetical protein